MMAVLYIFLFLIPIINGHYMIKYLTTSSKAKEISLD